jgi:thiol-disulfide isomerase/thioredoxin
MRIGSAVLLLPLLVLCGGCERKSADQQPQQQEVSGVPTKGVDRSHAGEAMPKAEIYNADDEKGSVAEASGKPVLVNLWASWCAPCVKELPTLDALSRKEGAPKVIAVSEDIGDRASVDAFLEQHGAKQVEAWRDPEMALSSALGVQVMPTTIYYDASGHEVWRYVGDLDWTGAEAARLLAQPANVAAG